MGIEGVIFIVIVMVGAYGYLLFALRNVSDAGAQYGFPITGLLAGSVGIAFGMFAALIIMMAGIAGYFFVCIAFPPLIIRMAKWMAISA
jgi:uncharacterized membrane protein YesL